MTSTRFSSLTAVALGLAALLPCTAALAQAGAACDPQSTQVEHLNACAVARFQHTDTAQNILYADVMRALSAHERPELRKDQTAWSRQRIATCKQRHAPDESRADWPQLYHDCLTEATEQRRKALMHWLHNGSAPSH